MKRSQGQLSLLWQPAEREGVDVVVEREGESGISTAAAATTRRRHEETNDSERLSDCLGDSREAAARLASGLVIQDGQ